MINESITNILFSDENEIKLAIEETFKHNIRIDVILLLRLFPSLNVTEISRLLNRNKATVGRHLKKMQKIKILDSQEKASKRNINPLYYSIHPIINKLFELVSKKEFSTLEDMKERRKALRQSLSVFQTIFKIVEHAIGLINPFMNYLKGKIEEEKLDIQELQNYLTLRRQLSIRHTIINEEDVDEFWKIHEEFYEKLETLGNKKGKNKQKSLLFVDSLLPLKVLLEHGSDENE